MLLLSMKTSTRLIAGLLIAFFVFAFFPSVGECQRVKQVKKSPVVVSIYSSGGFRRVEDTSDEKDYAWELREDDTWIFSLHRSGRKFYGKLDMESVTEMNELWEKVDAATEEEKADPRIADLPTVSITRGKDRDARIELRPSSETAKAVGKWVNSLRNLENETVIAHLNFPGKVRGVFSKPKSLKSMTELEEVLSKEEIEKLVKGINFKTQKIVLFQWSGSGQDRIDTTMITEGDKSVLNVQMFPGRTRDLRQHAHALVMPIEQEWKIKEK